MLRRELLKSLVALPLVKLRLRQKQNINEARINPYLSDEYNSLIAQKLSEENDMLKDMPVDELGFLDGLKNNRSMRIYMR